MKTSWIIVGVLALVLIGGFFFYTSGSNSTVASQSSSSDSSDQNVRVINIQASRFAFTPNAIHVKKGEHIRLVIDNTDTTHGIIIPSLGVKGIDSVEFTADTVGTFDFRCPTFCGDGHKGMTGTLIVEE